jgi:hypothetical protein
MQPYRYNNDNSLVLPLSFCSMNVDGCQAFTVRCLLRRK